MIESRNVDSKKQITFISALRSAAALCVVWDHLGAQWPTQHAIPWGPMVWTRQWITTPLHVTQDFGWFGVCLFFLISGFIITHATQRESRITFAVKRFFRIVPAFLVTVLLAVVLGGAAVTLGIASTNTYYSPLTILENVTLSNFVVTNAPLIVGVAWTLIIEILFYVLTWAMLPLVKSRPLIVLSFNLTVVAIADIGNWSYGPSWIRLVVNLSYIAILSMGQAIYFGWSGRISPRVTVFACVVAGAEFIGGTVAIPQQYFSGTLSFCVSLMYAIAIFVIALLLTDFIPEGRTLKTFADMSYSTYLLHDIVGIVVLQRVVAVWHSMTLGFVLALVATFVTSWLMFRTVERPSQRLARRITDRLSASTERTGRSAVGRLPRME